MNLSPGKEVPMFFGKKPPGEKVNWFFQLYSSTSGMRQGFI